MPRIALVLAACLAVAGAVPDLARPIVTGPEGTRWSAGQLILKLRPEVRGRVQLESRDGAALFGVAELDAVGRSLGVDDITPLDRRPVSDPLAIRHGVDLQYVVQFDPARSVPAAAARYEALPAVEYAVPNEWYEVTDIPNDTLYPVQWHLPNIGAPFAWDVNHGDTTVRIAVLDMGIEWHHPDIEPNLWVNAAEDLNANGRFDTLPPPDGDMDGVDQDVNGYADDVLGYDFFYGDPDPAPVRPEDDHGVHCWGISNAATDNGQGVAGVPWNCRGYAFACGGSGLINLYAAISGMYYAVPKGVWVFSMSFGGYSTSQPMADACNYAWDAGSVLVGGAGNDGTNRRFFPADYEHVISVAASGPSDTKTSWSNYGDWIEIVAPGSGIYATVTNHGYGPKDGTSMATPVVAGCLAWLKSFDPALTNAAACSLLYAACDSMPDPYYRSDSLGAGRVSIGNVVLPRYYCNLTLAGVRFNDATGNGNGRPDPGETVGLIVTYANSTGWQDATDVSAMLACATPGIVVTKSEATFPDIPAGASASCSADSFAFTVPDSLPPQELSFSLGCDAEPAPAWPDTAFTATCGAPRVLLVDDDEGADYQRWYASACDSNGVLYDVFTVAGSGSPSAETLRHYPVVVWFTGDDSLNTLTPTDRANLGSFLDQGGRLLISGQNLAQSIPAETFLADYLHAEFVTAATGKPYLPGVADDPITRGDTMVAGGGGGANNGRSLDGIRPANGGVACAGYKDYPDTTVKAAVRYAGAHRVVFFAAPFEAIDHATSRYLQKWTLVKRILEWFGERVPGVEEQPRPTVKPPSFTVSPNPARNLLMLRVERLNTRAQRARVSVVDVLGRAVLCSSIDIPSSHCAVSLNVSGLANGVYLVRFETPGEALTGRVVVSR